MQIPNSHIVNDVITSAENETAQEEHSDRQYKLSSSYSCESDNALSSPPSSLHLPSRFSPSFPLLPSFPLPPSSTTEANNSSNSNGSSKEPAQTTVANVTDRSHFAAIIASKDLTVVDYWAPWCKYVRN